MRGEAITSRARRAASVFKYLTIAAGTATGVMVGLVIYEAFGDAFISIYAAVFITLFLSLFVIAFAHLLQAIGCKVASMLGHPCTSVDAVERSVKD